MRTERINELIRQVAEAEATLVAALGHLYRANLDPAERGAALRWTDAAAKDAGAARARLEEVVPIARTMPGVWIEYLEARAADLADRGVTFARVRWGWADAIRYEVPAPALLAASAGQASPLPRAEGWR